MNDRAFPIDPHRGAGPIRFGMTRSDVESAMGSTPERGRRNPLSVADHDYFDDDGFFVYYSPDDLAVAIEFFELGKVSYPPDIGFDMPFDQLLAWVRKMDPGVVVKSSDYFQSDALGIAAGPQGDPEEQQTIESVLVYRPNYYQDSKRWSQEKSGS